MLQRFPSSLYSTMHLFKDPLCNLMVDEKKAEYMSNRSKENL
jgi:hypothetical protein